MRPSPRWAALAALLFLQPLATEAAAPPESAGLVSRIEVTGSQRISPADIQGLLGVEVGDPWSPAEVSQGLRRLYARGVLRDAAVWAAPSTEGIRLWVAVEEKPLVAGVEIDGAEHVGKKDLQEKLTMGAGDLWDEAGAREEREILLAEYRDRGYHQARIETEHLPLPDGRLRVRHVIEEGDKTRVREIAFQGNENVSAGALAKAMETRPRRWFTGGDYDEDTFSADLGRLADEYRSRGYLEARVTDHELRYDEEGGLTVLIEVEEGPQYHVGEISFQGNEELTLGQLSEIVKLMPGDVFDEGAFQESVETLYGAYGEKGFVYATVYPRRERRGTLVNVTFDIEEGEPARVGNIDIAGNYTTKEKIIRRQLFLVPGDLFRRSALIRSHREVFSLGFFEDVQIKTDVSRESPDIDLTFEVTERETGQFMAGASYSGEFGVVGSLEMSKNNLRGNGQYMSVKWEFGRLGQLELSFTEPWFRGTPTSAGFDLFNTRLRRESYTEKSRGGALRVGRPLPWLDYTRLYLRYKWEEWKVEMEDSGAEGSAEFLRRLSFVGQGVTSGVQSTLYRNSTDSPFFPTRGSIARVTSEFSGGWLGGDTGFQRHVVDYQWFFPTWRGLVLALGVRGGGLARFSTDGRIPLFERFRLGGTGANGLRGYPDLDVVPPGNDPAEGGLAMLIMRAEYKFPITGPHLFGLFFFDAGDVWNSVAEARPGSLRRGAGLGFRVEVPGMGTLGFDYGYGFDRGPELGGAGFELHFNIGSASFF